LKQQKPEVGAAVAVVLQDSDVLGAWLLTFNVRDHRLSDVHISRQQPGCGLLDIFLLAITILVDRFCAWEWLLPLSPQAIVGFIPAGHVKEATVPTYQYRCAKCGKVFEHVEHVAEHETAKLQCPQCGSREIEHHPTSFVARTSKKS
jgi:putative FmdB family regulatory protein